MFILKPRKVGFIENLFRRMDRLWCCVHDQFTTIKLLKHTSKPVEESPWKNKRKKAKRERGKFSRITPKRYI